MTSSPPLALLRGSAAPDGALDLLALRLPPLPSWPLPLLPPLVLPPPLLAKGPLVALRAQPELELAKEYIRIVDALQIAHSVKFARTSRTACVQAVRRPHGRCAAPAVRWRDRAASIFCGTIFSERESQSSTRVARVSRRCGRDRLLERYRDSELTRVGDG